ncbi:unnamed protein product [Durusdinium trenchii]|uniref:Uncharacterized protein n=1 Tax=Durusdinium trenchii TaxID=1381693 RepID=A0ABP0QPL6_9DINO
MLFPIPPAETVVSPVGPVRPSGRDDFATLRAGLESCWSAGFTAELCCDVPTYGEEGNPSCWDGEFNFQRCCSGAALPTATAEDAVRVEVEQFAAPALGHPPEELSVGLFPTYEPGKDCWTGSAATYARCCDLRISPMGDIFNCWDNNRFTFERCCFLGEAAPGQSPPKPLLRPALLRADQAKPAEAAALRPAGRECWVQGFTYAACCLGGLGTCWDEHFTREACCDGLPQLPEVGATVKSSDPSVDCLQMAQLAVLDLEQTPRQCSQRYWYLASMGAGLIATERLGIPRWFPVEQVAAVKPLRPQRMHFVGGLCLPVSCSTEVVASYLAPLVVPWWRSPRRAPSALNASHMVLPPPLAVRHKVYPREENQWSFQMFTALRPRLGEKLGDLERWDFAILLYDPLPRFGLSRQLMLVLSFLVIMVFFYLAPREIDAESSFLSPHFHWVRLGLSRGPKHLEVTRLLLTLVVLYIHVIDHGPWLPVPHRSFGASLMLFRSCLSRVNIGFVVLMVHLSISRRSLKQAPSAWSWMKGVAYHALKRWFVISPVVTFWTFVFIHAPFDGVPMNNILKSNPLYLWYGERRDHCVRASQMVEPRRAGSVRDLWRIRGPAGFLAHSAGTGAAGSLVHQGSTLYGILLDGVAEMAFISDPPNVRQSPFGILSPHMEIDKDY